MLRAFAIAKAASRIYLNSFLTPMNQSESYAGNISSGITRRAAIKTGIKGIIAYSMAPQLLHAALSGDKSPSNRLSIGLIGNGLICSSHYTGLIGRDDCRIVATCDVRYSKAKAMAARAEKDYGTAGSVAAYQHHEELLARKDIDAIFVCTPDHWHVAVALAAVRAGKDVYCEKPLTLSVREGRPLVNAARQFGRIVQTGTQQRSNASFRKAAELLRKTHRGPEIHQNATRGIPGPAQFARGADTGRLRLRPVAGADAVEALQCEAGAWRLRRRLAQLL